MISVNIKKNTALLQTNNDMYFHPLSINMELPPVGSDGFMSLGLVKDGAGKNYLDDKGSIKGYRFSDNSGTEIITDTFVQTVSAGGALIDEKNYAIALTNENIDLNDATYIVYDIETTGLSSNFDEIIEIGACKVKNGVIIDEFSSFVKPTVLISSFTTELTSITNDDVRFADPIEVVLPKFKEFIGDGILVAHNATFDNSHIYSNLRKIGLYKGSYPTIDTLQLFRLRYGKGQKKFGLDAMVKYFDITLVQHHRAVHDAKATALCFVAMVNDLLDHGFKNYNQIKYDMKKRGILCLIH